MKLDPVDLLRALVAIDSTSTRSNLPIAGLLADRIEALGFEVRLQRWTDDAGVEKANVVARRGPAADGGLALVGHTDCVPYDPAWDGALAGEVREGNLYGRGAADTKAFIACALAAAADAAPPERPLWLVFTADEEVGCLGAKRLLDEGAVRPGHAIVGEPTRLIPVRAHKGYCLAEVEIAGVEAHSAFPDLGASAILAAGRVLRELERLQSALASEADPLFAPPYTTLNVGLIRGGKAKNVVPGSCSFTVEWRPIPGQDVRAVLRQLEEACERAREGDPRLRATVRASRLDAGVSVGADAPIVRFLEAESGRASETIPFGTELPQLTALGAEACVFGPGDIRVAHRTGEFVPLAEVAIAHRVLARAIQRFCGR